MASVSRGDLVHSQSQLKSYALYPMHQQKKYKVFGNILELSRRSLKKISMWTSDQVPPSSSPVSSTIETKLTSMAPPIVDVFKGISISGSASPPS